MRLICHAVAGAVVNVADSIALRNEAKLLFRCHIDIGERRFVGVVVKILFEVEADPIGCAFHREEAVAAVNAFGKEGRMLDSSVSFI